MERLNVRNGFGDRVNFAAMIGPHLSQNAGTTCKLKSGCENALNLLFTRGV